MKNYAELMQKILDEGEERPDRTGVGTLSLFGESLSFDLASGFPLVTGKHTSLKTIAEELRWILSGSTNVNDLDSGIWNAWRRPYTLERKWLGVEPRTFEYEPCTVDREVFENGAPEGASFLESAWYTMMYMCYAETTNYFVCERWQTLSNFVEDVMLVPHAWYAESFSLMLSPAYYKSYMYGPDSCVWMSREEAQEYTFTEFRLELIPEGDLGLIYGHQWRGLQDHDQIALLVSGLRDSPYSRRHIVSAWNVQQLDSMALTPCHAFFQCYVHTDGRLDLQMHQRSADLFLGVGYNIASYALLTHLLADLCGLKVGRLIITFGDVHLYQNHIPQARTYLAADQYTLPQLSITESLNLETGDFGYGLVDYASGPRIAASVAV